MSELFLLRMGNFRLDPLALHAVLGKNEQQPIIEAYRFVNLLVDLLSAFDLMRSKPATHPVVLKVGMEPVCKFLAPWSNS